jgi:hypothetical protein
MPAGYEIRRRRRDRVADAPAADLGRQLMDLEDVRVSCR